METNNEALNRTDSQIRLKVYLEERDRLNNRIDATEDCYRGMSKTESYCIMIQNLINQRDYFCNKIIEIKSQESKCGEVRL